MARFAGAARSIGLEPLVVAIVALALEVRTLLPGLGFWDTAEFQTVGPVLGTAHPTGFPTFVIAEWIASIVLQPLGEPAYRMNLFSALCVSFGAGCLAILVRQLGVSRIIALGAGIGFALAPSVWRVATRADPHAFHVALVALLLVLLVAWEERHRSGQPTARRWFIAAAIVYGLALGNHGLSILVAPGIALFVLAVEPRLLHMRRLLLPGVAALLATVVIAYAELPIRALMGAPLVYATPGTPGGFLYVVFALQFHGSVSVAGGLATKIGTLWETGWNEMGPLMLLVPIAGAVTTLRRRRLALLTIPTFAITVLFSSVYTDGDIGRFYDGPILIAFAWLAVAAAEVLHATAAGAVGEPGLRPGWTRAHGLATSLALAAMLLGPAAASVPDRWVLLDRSGDRSGEEWLDQTLSSVDSNAVVISWWSYSTPLWYGQLVQHRRTDIWILDDQARLDLNLGSLEQVVRAEMGRRPVYLVRPANELRELATQFRIETVFVSITGQTLARVLGPLEGAS